MARKVLRRSMGSWVKEALYYVVHCIIYICLYLYNIYIYIWFVLRTPVKCVILFRLAQEAHVSPCC